MSTTGATYKADDLPEWDGKDATYSRFTRKIAKYKRTHKDQYMDNDFWTASNPRLRARVTRRRRAAASLAVSQKSTKSDVTGPAREPGIWPFDVQTTPTAYLPATIYNLADFYFIKLP